MTDINRIEGPSGSPNTPHRREQTPTPDKFKKEMQKRVEKVDESDAEQRKKRKRREELEPDEEAGAAQAPQDTSHIAPFSLQETEKGISPMEMQAGKGKISSMESAQRAPSPLEAFASPPPAAFTPPSSEEIEDDAQMMEVEPSAPSSATTPSPAIPQLPTLPPEETAYPTAAFPSTDAPSPTQQPTTSQTTTPTTSSTPSGQPPQTSSSTAAPRASQALPKGPAEKKISAEQLDHAVPSKEDAEAVLKVSPEELEKKGEPSVRESAAPEMAKPPAPPSLSETKKEEEEEEASAISDAQGIVPVTPTLTPSSTELESEKKKEDRIDTPTPTPPPSTPPPPLTTAEALPTSPSAPYTTLTPQVFDLFERMAGVMTVMTTTGLTETVVTLNAPQFASSVFYGTQIIIQEYSTAPKAFNIQIHGTPQAVAAFQGNTNDLMAAFQHGNYNFRVNRLETGYLEDRPAFRRKEKASGDKQDQPDQGTS